MDQQQNYIISLIAVFLALGIGILVGASMGENALVTNQIAVIEELKNEIHRHKEEVEAQFLTSVQLEEELLVWRTLEKEYLNPLLLEDRLKNVAVKIIVQGEMPANLVDFLELSGCCYQAFIFAETGAWLELSHENDEDVLFLEKNPAMLCNELLAPGAQGEECCLNEYGPEYYIAYGGLDPLYLECLYKIEQMGKTVLRVDAPEIQCNTSAEPEPAFGERFSLDNFYSKLKLLEFLQAV